MDFKFSPEEEKFKSEVHEFLKNEKLVQKARGEKESGLLVGPETRKLWRELGEKGWLCPHWPVEYGGLGLPHFYRHVLEEEFTYFNFNDNGVAGRSGGPVILDYGSESQKKFFLPKIARGEIEFALGYTEPQAGSDLASIEMKAEEKEESFILNGHKVFNAYCHFAEYHWLMARTEVTEPKYRGLSLFIIDLKTPGITIKPMWALGGYKGTSQRVNEVFYDNVKVSRECLVGNKNRGFYMLMEALAYERVTPASFAERKLKEVIQYIKKTGKGENPLIRQRLADLYLDVEVLKLLAMKISWMIGKHTMPTVEAAMAKNIICNYWEKLANFMVDILGDYGLLHKDSEWVIWDGRPEWEYRSFLINRITRGTPEIMNNIIAQRGLELPR